MTGQTDDGQGDSPTRVAGLTERLVEVTEDERNETAVVDAAALTLVPPSATTGTWTAARSCGRSVWGHWVPPGGTPATGIYPATGATVVTQATDPPRGSDQSRLRRFICLRPVPQV